MAPPHACAAEDWSRASEPCVETESREAVSAADAAGALRVSGSGDRHPIGLACGAALAAVSAIDFYTAKSLSLVAYVQPRVVALLQPFELGVERALRGRGGRHPPVLALPLPRGASANHPRSCWARQTVGLTLDVFGLLASTLFGKHSKPLYLLLEAGMVQLSTVLLFSTWYAAIDHHRQVARADGQVIRPRIGFPQQASRYPGYEHWAPSFVDYLTFAFTTSSSLGRQRHAAGDVSEAPRQLASESLARDLARPRGPRHRPDRLSASGRALTSGASPVRLGRNNDPHRGARQRS